MTDARTAAATHPGRNSRAIIFSHPARRRFFLVSTTVVLVAVTGLNWDWLTSVGLGPVLISLLPCVVMCALGLCMHGGTGASCSSRRVAGETSPTPDDSQS